MEVARVRRGRDTSLQLSRLEKEARERVMDMDEEIMGGQDRLQSLQLELEEEASRMDLIFESLRDRVKFAAVEKGKEANVKEANEELDISSRKCAKLKQQLLLLEQKKESHEEKKRKEEARHSELLERMEELSARLQACEEEEVGRLPPSLVLC